jgi:predicted nuclease with TOPRIM domain
MEPKANSPYQDSKKKSPMLLITVVITLSVIAILLALKLYIDTRRHNENVQFIEAEKSKLEGELNYLIVEYDSLKMQSDSLAGQLEAEQDKIRNLLKREASSATKIKMYQRELETLRKVMRSYIVQIDSLNTRNLELTEENIQVRRELHQISTNYEELSKEKEVLSSTVKEAQRLSAKNIISEGLNRNSKPKDRISKIEKIRVCFTVRENAVAQAGSKMIYLTITRPDDIILSSPDAGMFMLGNESRVYTSNRELEYDNADIDICIYWDISEELIEGTYFINLYCEGFEIGSSILVLK